MSVRRVLASALVASLVVSLLPSPGWAVELAKPAGVAAAQATAPGLRASIEREATRVALSERVSDPAHRYAPPVRAQMGPQGGGGGGGGWLVLGLIGLAVSAAATYYIIKQTKKQTTTTPQ